MRTPAEARTRPSIFESQDYQAFLEEWKSCCGLSHRQIARETGQADAGVVSNLIAGRRPFTLELQAAFVPVMKLTAEEAQYLSVLVDLRAAREDVARWEGKHEEAKVRERGDSRRATRKSVAVTGETLGAARRALQELEAKLQALQAMHQDQARRDVALRVAGALLVAVIRELASTPGYHASPEWIGERLRMAVSKEEIRDALRVLDGLGVQEGTLATAAEVDREAVRPYYQQLYQDLGRALNLLFVDDQAHLSHHLGAVTLAIPASAVAEAKATLQRAQQDIFALSIQPSAPKTTIYQAFFAAWPLTREL